MLGGMAPPRRKTAKQLAADVEAVTGEQAATVPTKRTGTPAGTQKRRPATKRTVKKAAAGKSPRRPTTAQIVERNLKVVVMYETEFKTFAQIAAELGVDEKTAREGYSVHTEQIAPLLGGDSMGKVLEFIRKLEGAQAKYAEFLNSTEKGSNAVTRMTALRHLVDTMWREIELRQAVGLLPSDLSSVATEMKTRWIMEQVGKLLEKYKMPPEAIRELHEILATRSRLRMIEGGKAEAV